MNTGRTILAQIMDYLLTYEFRQCVVRYSITRARASSVGSIFLNIAFVQLTDRESLRDIQACLRAATQKPYHIGIRGKISRNTLAHAHSDKRLAYLCRFCTNTHSESQATLCKRFIWYRVGTKHLRTGCHDHRLMPVSLSVDGIPEEQGCCKTAHVSRSTRQHPNDSFYYQRKSSRSQYPRQAADRSRCHLHHGSRLSGLWASLQTTSIGSILCDARQEQRQIRPAILSEDRQNVWTQIRPGHYAARLLLQERWLFRFCCTRK